MFRNKTAKLAKPTVLGKAAAILYKFQQVFGNICCSVLNNFWKFCSFKPFLHMHTSEINYNVQNEKKICNICTKKKKNWLSDNDQIYRNN